MFKATVQKTYLVIAEKIYYHGRAGTRPYHGKYIYITDSKEYASEYSMDNPLQEYSIPFSKDKIFSIKNNKHLTLLEKHVGKSTLDKILKDSGAGNEIDWAVFDSYISSDEHESGEELLGHQGFYGVKLQERTGIESILIFDESTLKQVAKS